MSLVEQEAQMQGDMSLDLAIEIACEVEFDGNQERSARWVVVAARSCGLLSELSKSKRLTKKQREGIATFLEKSEQHLGTSLRS